jgi:hypothetical protein
MEKKDSTLTNNNGDEVQDNKLKKRRKGRTKFHLSHTVTPNRTRNRYLSFLRK